MNEFNFKKYAWSKFKQNKPALWSFRILIAIILIALFSPFIANEQPLYVNWEGNKLYPAFNTLTTKSKTDSIWLNNSKKWEVIYYDRIDWRSVSADFKLFAPIAYSAEFNDTYNRDFIAPWDNQRYKNDKGEITSVPWYLKHWLGTDKIGRDVAAGLVHGAKISMFIGLISIVLAGSIGLLLGTVAGFFGDNTIKISRIQKVMIWIFVVLGYFFSFETSGYIITETFESGNNTLGFIYFFTAIIFWIFIVFLGYKIGSILHFIPYLNHKKFVKVDGIISRLIELLNSLPTLILIITVAAIMNERSLGILILIIGLTSWTGIARFMRAEMMRIRNLEYIQTAKVMGFGYRKILWKHAFPNAVPPVFVSLAFGVASAVLVESGLSFLGIGVPDEMVTWGSLLSLGRQEFEASWLVIFPGLAIFTTITIFNLIGEGLRDALDPRLKKNNE